MLYVITGTRRITPELGQEAAAMLGEYLALSPALQAIVARLAAELRRAAAPVALSKPKASAGI